MISNKKHQERNTGALARCKSLSFDVNQQAESLNEWEQSYNQHSRGNFCGYLDELKIGNIHFFEEFTNQTLVQQCSVRGDNLWLGFSVAAQQAKINHFQANEGQIMVRSSNIEFELITPPNFHIYGLVVNKTSLSRELVEADLEQWLDHASEIQVTKPNSKVCYELSKIISLLLNNDNSPLASHQFLDNHIQSRLTRLTPLITSKIADLLLQTESLSNVNQLSHNTIVRIIGTIDNYIKETDSYPLTTTKLCEITNVSRRTLQYCFEKGLGMSPIHYIRNCRLNEIRRVLLKENNELTIADLSLNFGFFHLATFNSHYKTLFGETPSQTIKRSENYHEHLDLLATVATPFFLASAF